MNLNVGCGTDVRNGWVNVDIVPRHGVVVADIRHLPFPDNTFDLVEASHVLEHLVELLPAVQELWRVLKSNGALVAKVPYGSSDDAIEDPTHVRQFVFGSWSYFSQPIYYRSDYGYRGDFKVEKVVLFVDGRKYGPNDLPELRARVVRERNIVIEMVAIMRAVKPIRDTSKPMDDLPIEFRFTTPKGGKQ